MNKLQFEFQLKNEFSSNKIFKYLKLNIKKITIQKNLKKLKNWIKLTQK